MSAQAVEIYLDETAVSVKKDDFLHAWISPVAKKNHARTDKQIRWLCSLFSILANAFKKSGLQLNKPSALQRITNSELPELVFWICRPAAKGPTYMLIAERKNDKESRAWKPELEQKLAVK